MTSIRIGPLSLIVSEARLSAGLSISGALMRIFFALAALLLAVPAFAATATINWSAPATATDGSPLTGAQTVTSYQVWVSTATIPTNTTMSPTATITGTATTTTQTIAVLPGGTIYARVKACNSAGCSDFSAEASKLLPVSTPGVPTSVTVTLSLQ